MRKSTNFTGQPILNQLLMYIDRGNIRKIAAKHQAYRYVKKFTTHNHLVVMLFIAFEGYQSIRESILGLLAIPFRAILCSEALNIFRGQPAP